MPLSRLLLRETEIGDPSRRTSAVTRKVLHPRCERVEPSVYNNATTRPHRAFVIGAAFLHCANSSDITMSKFKTVGKIMPAPRKHCVLRT